jgi:hypothetical protein
MSRSLGQKDELTFHTLCITTTDWGRSLMRSAMITISLLVTAACAYWRDQPPIERPAEGYQAIRFNRTISVRDHAVNTLTFTPGSTFVADRKFDYGTVYCGNTLVNGSLSPLPECMALEEGADTVLVLRPDSIYTVRREIPAGSVERIRIR